MREEQPLLGKGCGKPIAGAILSGVVSKKVTIKKSYMFLFIACIGILPIALGSFLVEVPLGGYGLILIGEIACILFATIFNVFAQTFVQKNTPDELMKKIMALVMAIVTCAYPLGQAMYGVLFDTLQNAVWLVILIGMVFSLMVSVVAKSNLRNLKNSDSVI